MGRGPRANDATAARRIDEERRRGLAIQLRIDGYTTPEIANYPDPDRPGHTLYSDKVAAWRAIKLGIDRLSKPNAEEWLAILTERHEQNHRRIQQQIANAPDGTQVDVRLFAEDRQTLAELAKLHGVNALDAKMGAYLEAKTVEAYQSMQQAFLATIGQLGLTSEQEARAARLMAEALRDQLALPAGDDPNVIDAEVIE